MSIFAQAFVSRGAGPLELPPLLRRMSKLIDAAAQVLPALNSASPLAPPTHEEAMIIAARSAFGWTEPSTDDLEF